MFKECSIDHFGKLAGLTKQSETQFGWNLIAALQNVSLEETLLMCICKSKFVMNKKHLDDALVLEKENKWGYVFAVCHAFHLIMQMI